MKLEALFEQLYVLPTIPKVAMDLMRQFNDPDIDVDTLARSIRHDPVVAAKVLRLANSARYHGLRDCTSVEDASMRLGFNTLRTLVLASAIASVFPVPRSFDLAGFWRNSFEVAGICRLLARMQGADVETAFTCGMMHIIGELLIQCGAPEQASHLRLETTSTGHAAEETLQLGFGYPEVGAELARRWNLPKVIQDSIAFQLHPAAAPPGEPMPVLVAQAVLVSDVLRTQGGITAEARDLLSGPLMASVDLDALLEALPQVLEDERSFAEMLA